MSNSKRRAARHLTLWARVRRVRRRLYRRHPRARWAVNALAAAACLLALLAIGANLLLAPLSRSGVQPAPEVEIAAPAIDTADRPADGGSEEASRQRPTEAAPVVTTLIEAPITPAPTPVPTPEPSPSPVPSPTMEAAPQAELRPNDGLEEAVYQQLAAPATDYADPETNQLISRTTVIPGEAPAAEIRMGASSGYSRLEGVTTFRGSNYRDGGSYGVIPENPSQLRVIWKKRIGGLDTWSGVGWTGQASLVRWPADVRQKMNIVRGKKDKEGLVEVIYGTLDGHIYFLDADDGQNTRGSINIGAPIKGSLAVDPRGVPLLYCGQGIYDVNGRRVECGTRIWSLYDQKQLYFLDGKDSAALRAWRAFDCSPLVDGETDTLITAGENGILYKLRLNSTQYGDAVAVNPTVTRYIYQQTSGGKLGTENSIAVYNSYAYFATNIGIIQCVDLNTMSLVWSFDARDDIDASLVIEPEGEGLVALYAVNELDRRGTDGTCQMFKLNALTGELLWKRDSDPIRQSNENGGGGFATPAVGKQGLSELVYFHVCRTRKTGGMLYALDKRTGDTVWSVSMGSYGWSSPTCVYTESGRGYVLVGSSSGKLRLFDGLTGATVAQVALRGNIEGTPAVFDDTIVIGTRSSLIYGIRIS